ncbi:penicillin-binding protein [Demequina pelophila]|uniref:penicillin-binding protein n=1 Tax=Demequina pelophila TaxID=1638984 RepID=UPI0009E34567|nr:penicillin-binding protein [Demequina pelophila]
MARSQRRPRTKVTFVQFVTAVALFVGLAIMGGFLLAGLALPAVTVAGQAAKGSSELFEELPQELSDVRLPQQSNIYDRTGNYLLATFYEQNRVVVPLEEISPWLVKAVVAIEDKRFFEHHGVDGEGLMRAVYVNLTSDSSPGASTLTQQLVKNTILQQAIASEDEDAIAEATEVSLARKIREWRLALALEENLDNQYGVECSEDNPAVDCGKEQILQQYLNIAQFGPNTYGVEAASQYYFDKPAKDLNAIEAATVAGITQNPSKWNPLRFPENATQRRNTVLLTMYEQGDITRAEFDEYISTPLEDTMDVNRPKVSCVASEHAPFFCDYVTRIIRTDDVFNQDDLELSGSDLLLQGGLDIVTTLDLDKQKIANEELQASLPADDPSGWAAALVSLDPDNGEVLAMAQSKEFDPAADSNDSTAINYSVSVDEGGSRGFSPGSTFKPVVLTAWLRDGRSLQETIDGRQKDFDMSTWTATECLDPGNDHPFTGQPEWGPGNVEGYNANFQTVLHATANSVNTAYAEMANQLDLCDIKQTAEDLGFRRADGAEIQAVPSMALGVNEASPLTMAQVAQVFANGGVRCDPRAILSVVDAEGNSLDVPPDRCERVIEKEVADGVVYGMREVMKAGTGKALNLDGGRQAAGKTGTAQENTHTWFMGYTPQLVTTVWIGNPNKNEPGQNITLGGQYFRYLYGSSLAGPTWQNYMNRALEGAEMLTFDDPTTKVLQGEPRPVPSIIGLSESQARRVLAAEGFKLAAGGGERYTLSYAEGTIVGQTPSANWRALPGSTVGYVTATHTPPPPEPEPEPEESPSDDGSDDSSNDDGGNDSSSNDGGGDSSSNDDASQNNDNGGGRGNNGGGRGNNGGDD